MLLTNHLSPLSIRKIASIDLKAEEEGIHALSRALKRPFVWFSEEELNKIGTPSSSEFVKKISGVYSVSKAPRCESPTRGGCW